MPEETKTIKIIQVPQTVSGPGHVRLWWKDCLLAGTIEPDGRVEVSAPEALLVLHGHSMAAAEWYKKRDYAKPGVFFYFEKGVYEIVTEPVTA